MNVSTPGKQPVVASKKPYTAPELKTYGDIVTNTKRKGTGPDGLTQSTA